MIFIVNDSFKVLTTVFEFNNPELHKPFHVIVNAWQLILGLVCLAITWRTVRIIWRIRVFHKNLTIILVFHLSSYLIFFIARIMVTSYTHGFLDVDISIVHVHKEPNELEDFSDNNPYRGLWVLSEGDMPKIKSLSDAKLLFIGSYLMFFYLSTAFTCIAEFCVERIFATLMVRDYEKHDRSYIGVFILTVSSFFSSWESYLMFFIFYPLYDVIACIVFVVVILIMLYLAVYMHNFKIYMKIKRTGGTSTKYPLAYRFQINENIKSFKVIYQVEVCSYNNGLVMFKITE
ncbi:unnamed protein product [Caenorhabditis bovis]|uniref:Uncharacterized protein n=1 Tax=Caenorhabditis bovis TaxID=2654633 RepID=A0A8S1FBX8_9PELO|nr:unnamed protein product [Caenorhabditis bovis]